MTAVPPTSARSILNELLSQFGLSSLADWAWKTYTEAGGGDLGLQLVQSELPERQEYKQRFPAILARQQKGLAAISPADYLNYETTVRQAFVSHGLPLPTTGHDFNDIIAGLLEHDVSASEVVNDRIGKAFNRVANAPVEVRDAARRVWGIDGEANLAALFLDPERTSRELERLSQSMSIAGNASRFGLDVGADRAGRLADLGAADQLNKLGDVAQLAPLFAENADENVDLTAEGEGLSAAFGEDAQSAEEINRRLAERKAAFSGGGRPSSSQRSTAPGLTGLGAGPGG